VYESHGPGAEKLVVAVLAIGFLGDTIAQAVEDFWPGYAHTFTRNGRECG